LSHVRESVPRYPRHRSTQLKSYFLVGFPILAVISGIFLMIVAPSITKLLLLVALICLLAGSWSRLRDWRSLQRTFAETYREALAGRLPRRAPWQTALNVIGFGLLVLSLWRAWSGLQ
jgi:hypothetical protein